MVRPHSRFIVCGSLWMYNTSIILLFVRLISTSLTVAEPQFNLCPAFHVLWCHNFNHSFYSSIVDTQSFFNVLLVSLIYTYMVTPTTRHFIHHTFFSPWPLQVLLLVCLCYYRLLWHLGVDTHVGYFLQSPGRKVGTVASVLIFLPLWCCWRLEEWGIVWGFASTNGLGIHWLQTPHLTNSLSHDILPLPYSSGTLQCLSYSGIVVTLKVEIVANMCLLLKQKCGGVGSVLSLN